MSATRLNYYQAAPQAMKAMLGLESAAEASSLPLLLRELVRIRTSQINGCAYCIELHTSSSLNAGENPRRLMTLSAWQETPFFTPQERAALLWAERLTRLPNGPVDEATYHAVAAHFNEQELTELTFVIAAINAWNRFGVGFGAQPQ